MARVFLLGTLGLACLASSARAADWSITSNVSQSVEMSDNPQLSSPTLGRSLNSYTGINLDALALTPTSRFETIGNLKYRAYSGPGESGQLNSWDKNIAASYEKQQKLTTYNTFGSYSETSSAAQQLVETGFSTLSGSTITKTFGGGLRHEFSALDSAGLNVTYTSTDFTGNNSTPFTSLSTTADWRHHLTPLVDILPNVQVQRLVYEGPNEARVLFAVGTLGLQMQLSPRADFYVGAGPVWAQASSNENVPVVPIGPVIASPEAAVPAASGQSSSGSGWDWQANGTFTYRWTRSLTAVLSAARTTGPTTFGSFQTSETVSGSLAYAINSYSSITATESFSHVTAAGGGPLATAAFLFNGGGTPGGGASDVITTTVGYSQQLARDWFFSANYQFIKRETNPSAQSNTIVLTLSRNLTVLPPGASLGHPVRTAAAADLPTRGLDAPVVPSWTGFYAGGNLGWAHANDPGNAISDTFLAGILPGANEFVPVTAHGSDNAGMVGIHGGYNWQFAPQWLLGFEADVDWTDLHTGGTVMPLQLNPIAFGPDRFCPRGCSATASSTVRAMGSVRGRFGFLWENWLLYGSGGFAWANVDYRASNQFFGITGVNDFNKTQSGWAAGVGVEHRGIMENWLLGRNWIFGLEYLFYRFDGTSVDTTILSCACTHFSFSNLDVQTVRARLSYKFNGW